MQDFKEIRWKQRFQNFDKAFNKLNDGIRNFNNLDEIGKEGLVQRFEYTFELAWKVLKDYLENKGISTKTPNETIKSAFQSEIITEGEVWMQMLNQRNLLAHTYNENNFKEAIDKITNLYYQQIENLHKKLRQEV